MQKRSACPRRVISSLWITGLLGMATSVCAEESTYASLLHEVDAYIAATDAAPATPTLTASWRNGPVLESDDGAFMIRLRGRLLWDAIGRDSDTPVAVENSEIFLRQGRIGVRGRILTNTIFMAEVDFGLNQITLMDIFVGLRKLDYLGSLTIGHQREPFSLDGVTPIPFHAFLERASATNVFAPSRSVGIRAAESGSNDRVTWSAGFYSADDEPFSGISTSGGLFAARVTGLPISVPDARKLLHVGISFTARNPPNGIARLDGRPGVRVGPVSVDTGDMPADLDLRAGIEVLYMVRSWRVQAEVFGADISGETDARFGGWYVSTSYWITGEQAFFVKKAATYGRTSPLKNFKDGKRGHGAVEVGFRYSYVDLNDGEIRGGQQKDIAFGVNWHWNPHTRVMLNLGHADVKEGPLGSGTGYNLKIRMQFDF
jgi:phosphate-selective porin OprO/OprP